MKPDDPSELLLCCLLWAREGAAAGLTVYEDDVLSFVPEHGGEVVQRVGQRG